MRRTIAIILLICASFMLFTGCSYYDDYQEIMALKQKYDQAMNELRAAKAEIGKMQAQVETLIAENKDMKEKLKRYAGGVKKMYE